MLLASDWQNPVNGLDVNDDGRITAADASMVADQKEKGSGLFDEVRV